MIITHPKVKIAFDANATLPYARFNDNEPLAEHVERVGEKGLVKIGIKMTASHKTIKAQSFAINALKFETGIKMTASHKTIKAQSFAINTFKYLQTANPHPPVSQSQDAYHYTLRFDPREAPQVNLIKEFPGIENVIDKKAAPVFIQSIFDTLPLPICASLLLDGIS
ncbi:hypothetical protein ACHAPQ_001988 [Fusarium lateritium]